MNHLFALLLFLSISLLGIGQERILVGPGPEDIVLDLNQDHPRLLISCSSRREGAQAYGEIESLGIRSGKRMVMERVGEPESLRFRPHGIYLIRIDNTPFLYVISHDDERNSHPIIRYEIKDNRLIFNKLFNNPLLVSPNALTVFPDGSFLVCNDAAVRGKLMEKILKTRKANIIYYDGQGNWNVVAKRLGMPAGMNRIGDQIYVSAATENKVYAFRFESGKLTNKRRIIRVKGPDNIRIHEGRILVACHEKPFRFIRHVNDPSAPSPSSVYLINPETGDTQRVFHDNGENLSAGSVAVEYESNLYIGQIFGNYVIREKGLGIRE